MLRTNPTQLQVLFFIPLLFAFGCETGTNDKFELGDKPFGAVGKDMPIQEIVAQTFVLQDFEVLLVASRVSGEMTSPPYTVFAPWDKAFERLPYWTKITRNRAWHGHLRDLTLGHIHAGNLPKDALEDGMTVTMLNGDVANITKERSMPRVDGIRILANTAASDGYLYLLNEVREPKWTKRTILDIINEDERFGILSQILSLPTMSDKREELQSTTAELTFFAPTDDALAGFDVAQCTDSDCLAQLDLLIGDHLVETMVPKLFYPSQSLTSQSGKTLNWDFETKSISFAAEDGVSQTLEIGSLEEVFSLNGIVQPVNNQLFTRIRECLTDCGPGQCGTVDDGCGGTLDCGSCAGIAEIINVAYRKSTSQSSIDLGGDSSRAVDGNTNGYFPNNSTTQTKNESAPPPWWQVDLGGSHYVERVTVLNRSVTNTQWLTDFVVKLLAEDGETVIDSYYHPGVAERETAVEVSGSGVYFVRVELTKAGILSLAEVQVWGPRVCTPSLHTVPSQLEGPQSYTDGSYPAGTFMPEKTGNYLIITTPEVEPWLAPFVAYRSLDYKVTVLNTDTIGNCQRNIKAAIQAQYNNPDTRPEFLLLAMKPDEQRSHHLIPWFDLKSRSFPVTDFSKVTYAPYAMLRGNDNIPDVYMGLLTVRNQQQVTNVLNKIKSMESSGHKYDKRAGFYTSLGTALEEEYAPFLGDDWSTTAFYHEEGRDGIPLATPEEIDALSEMLDSNLHLLYMGGHGSTSCVGGLCSFHWNDTSVGNNAEIYPVLNAASCDVGDFGNYVIDDRRYTYGPEKIFPEHVVFGLEKGPVGMAASSSAAGGSDYNYSHGFARALGENASTIGAIHHLGLLNTLETDDSKNTLTDYETLIIRRHLWGDPATQLFGRDRLRDSTVLHVVFGDGDGLYSAGDKVEINAEEPKTPGCRFVQWTGDVDVLQDEMSPSTTAIIGGRDIMVEANFRCDVVQEIPGTIQGELFSFIYGSMPQFHKRNVVGMLCEDESVEYTVKAQTAGHYTLTLNYATASDDLAITLVDASSDKELGSELLPQHTPPGFATYRLSGHEGRHLQTEITAPAGRSTFRIRVDSGCMSIDSITFSLAE